MDEYLFLPTWGTACRVIFGNNAGIFNNVYPKIALKKSQLESKINRDLSETDKELIKHGYIALKSEFAPALLKTIKTKLEQLFQSPKDYVAAGEPPHQQAHRILKNPLDKVPELKELYTERIDRLIKNYYGSYYRVENIRCWRNMHVDGVNQNSNIFSNQWHNDQFDTNLLKYFVYLNDEVTAETGAFRVHSAVSTRTIMRSLGYFRRSHIFGKARRMIDSPSLFDVIEGKLGDGFIFNPTICLHRAGVPKKDTYRDVIQFEFKPSGRPISDFTFSRLKKDTFQD